jgi:hypothetical protein
MLQRWGDKSFPASLHTKGKDSANVNTLVADRNMWPNGLDPFKPHWAKGFLDLLSGIIF